MKNIKFFFLIALFTSCQHYATSQQRFNAGFVAGLNFAELEGDGIEDFFGVNAGIMGIAKLSKRTQLSMELVFSQNGEYILPLNYPRITYGKIRLNHLEIPVHFDYLIRKKEGDYYQVNLNIGMAYTRLFSHYAEALEGLDVTDSIIYDKKDAFQLQAGLVYQFNKNWGLNLKLSTPLRPELDITLAARMIYLL